MSRITNRSSLNKSCLTLVAVQVFASPAVYAATVVVDTSSDVGNPACSLREAITTINSQVNSGDCVADISQNSFGSNDEINFSQVTALPATITLTSALPQITRAVKIDAPQITINANGVGRGLYITGASVKISDLTITHGVTPDIGGGIYGNGSNNLVLENVTLQNNTAGLRGGGIAIVSASAVDINDSIITNNTVFTSGDLNVRAGGGVHVGNLGQIAITRTQISGNRSQFKGGGIYSVGSVTVNESLISGNSAGQAGGGIYTKDSSLTFIKNSTISGNTADATGGGLQGYDAFNISLLNVTVAENQAPARGAVNVIGASGPVGFNNTIIADHGTLDCYTNSTSSLNSSNIVESGYCDAATSGARVVDPLILPLGANGGPTRTHALASDSPAINTGNNAICPVTDQRGEPRPATGANRCDVGAFEAPDASTFFIIPAQNGGKAVIEL